MFVSATIGARARRGAATVGLANSTKLAAEVSRIWRETTPLPLPYVSSDAVIANSVAFYMDGHPVPSALPADQAVDKYHRRHEEIRHRVHMSGRLQELRADARRH